MTMLTKAMAMELEPHKVGMGALGGVGAGDCGAWSWRSRLRAGGMKMGAGG